MSFWNEWILQGGVADENALSLGWNSIRQLFVWGHRREVGELERESCVVSEENNRKGQERHSRYASTKHIIYLSKCFAVCPAKTYWFFAYFTPVSRGKAGARTVRAVDFEVLTPKNTLLVLTSVFLNHLTLTTWVLRKTRCNINIFTVNYYLHVCTFYDLVARSIYSLSATIIIKTSNQTHMRLLGWTEEVMSVLVPREDMLTLCEANWC